MQIAAYETADNTLPCCKWHFCGSDRRGYLVADIRCPALCNPWPSFTASDPWRGETLQSHPLGNV
jgi:hypothetical protein